MFEVQSCCYVTILVLEWTVWCSRTVWFFVMFDMFEVWFWAKMWCLECSMFGHSMFGVFKVWSFGVRSKTSTDVIGLAKCCIHVDAGIFSPHKNTCVYWKHVSPLCILKCFVLWTAWAMLCVCWRTKLVTYCENHKVYNHHLSFTENQWITTLQHNT